MRLYFYLLAAAVVGVLAWSYQYNLNKIKQLSENLLRTEQLLQTSQAAISTLQANADKQAKLDVELQQELSQAETRVQELKTLLSKHDLEFLALQKPQLIERRLNDATRKVFDDLELITSDR